MALIKRVSSDGASAHNRRRERMLRGSAGTEPDIKKTVAGLCGAVRLAPVASSG